MYLILECDITLTYLTIISLRYIIFIYAGLNIVKLGTIYKKTGVYNEVNS